MCPWAIHLTLTAPDELAVALHGWLCRCKSHLIKASAKCPVWHAAVSFCLWHQCSGNMLPIKRALHWHFFIFIDIEISRLTISVWAVGLLLTGEEIDVRFHSSYSQSQRLMQVLIWESWSRLIFFCFMREKVCSQIYVLPKTVDIFIACFLMLGKVSFGREA